jgi:5-amino-6-(5-phospho-D-ribitylamino)uracil phosphatase
VVQGSQRVPLDPVTQWWFSTMNVRARFLDEVSHDEHPEHTVRVGACAPSGQLHDIEDALARIAGPRGVIHNFPAVVAPKEATHHARGLMHIIELFDAEATKWSGISHVAQRFGVPQQRIAAIGDEINDMAMITQAGLGIAMGNAVPRVREAAKRQTATNNEDGLAKAIDKMLMGEW